MKKVTLAKIVLGVLVIAVLGISVGGLAKPAIASEPTAQTQIVKHDEQKASEAAKMVESFEANKANGQIVEEGKVQVSAEEIAKQDMWCQYEWYCNAYGYCFYRYVCVR